MTVPPSHLPYLDEARVFVDGEAVVAVVLAFQRMENEDGEFLLRKVLGMVGLPVNRF